MEIRVPATGQQTRMLHDPEELASFPDDKPLRGAEFQWSENQSTRGAYSDNACECTAFASGKRGERRISISC